MNRGPVIGIVGGGDLAVGVERIAVTGEGTDLEIVLAEEIGEGAAGGGVIEQGLRLAVGRAGITTCADFDRLATGGRDIANRFGKRLLRKENRENTDLHACLSLQLDLAANDIEAINRVLRRSGDLVVTAGMRSPRRQSYRVCAWTSETDGMHGANSDHWRAGEWEDDPWATGGTHDRRAADRARSNRI